MKKRIINDCFRLIIFIVKQIKKFNKANGKIITGNIAKPAIPTAGIIFRSRISIRPTFNTIINEISHRLFVSVNLCLNILASVSRLIFNEIVARST